MRVSSFPLLIALVIAFPADRYVSGDPASAPAEYGNAEPASALGDYGSTTPSEQPSYDSSEKSTAAGKDSSSQPENQSKGSVEDTEKKIIEAVFEEEKGTAEKAGLESETLASIIEKVSGLEIKDDHVASLAKVIHNVVSDFPECQSMYELEVNLSEVLAKHSNEQLRKVLETIGTWEKALFDIAGEPPVEGMEPDEHNEKILLNDENPSEREKAQGENKSVDEGKSPHNGQGENRLNKGKLEGQEENNLGMGKEQESTGGGYSPGGYSPGGYNPGGSADESVPKQSVEYPQYAE